MSKILYEDRLIFLLVRGRIQIVIYFVSFFLSAFFFLFTEFMFVHCLSLIE